MWREYQTFADRTDIFCAACAVVDQKKTGTVNADGKIMDEDCGLCDQIGWLVPAVPDVDGHGFWGYSSVPQDGCEWWKSLPTHSGPRATIRES